jgi:phage-related tail protein
MSQTNGEESSEQQVSPVNEATSYKEKKLEEYDSSQTTEQTRTSFKYIPGAQGKVDVWFIIGLCGVCIYSRLLLLTCS